MEGNNSLSKVERVASCSNILLVFKKWSQLRMKSGSKRLPKLTSRREFKFAISIRDHGIDQVLLVLDFLLSDDDYSVWMRNNKYTTIENIFNKKLFDKIKRSEKYFDNRVEPEEKHDLFMPFIITDGEI